MQQVILKILKGADFMGVGKRKYRKKLRPVSLLYFSIMAIVLMLTIGYANYAVNFSISNISAHVRIQKDIRITDLVLDSVSNSGESTYDEFNAENISIGASLPYADSSITYNVTVTNYGNVEMGISSISGLDQDLEYTLTGYTMEATLCDSIDNTKCKLGSVTTFQITISYADGAYDGVDTTYAVDLGFNFYQIEYIARIGSQYYRTLQAAVDAVPKTNTSTTIVLLKNTAERIAVNPYKDVVIDFQGLVLSNSGNSPVIEVTGKEKSNGQLVANGDVGPCSLTMINGSIFTNSTTISNNSGQAAINVENGGTFIMTGGTIIATGDKQALYVDKDSTASISGNSYLRAQAYVEANKYRGTVQTVSGGTLTITSGTIEAVGTNGIAVSNAGVTTIGVKDGNVSTSSPLMIGTSSGIYYEKGTVNFYDGIAKGQSVAIENENSVVERETGYGFLHGSEMIDGHNYDTVHLSVGVTVTFDPNGGSVSEQTRSVVSGMPVGNLPVPTRSKYIFDGWFTSNNQQVTANTIVVGPGPVVYTAHWTHVDDSYVAQIGNTSYHTVVEAVAAAPTNTATTITLIKNTAEQITVASGKNIILDIGDYTISNNGTKSVLEITGGTVTMISGTITTATTQGAVNVKNGGQFNITAGEIIATNNRQAIYIENGSANISGTAHLSAKAAVDNETDKKRGTVQVLANGSLVVTGGTIEAVGTKGIGISNAGIATVGIDDGNVSTTSPTITAVRDGISSTGTLNFYDGVARGRSHGIVGTVNDWDSNSTVTTVTEQIGGVTYYSTYLN